MKFKPDKFAVNPKDVDKMLLSKSKAEQKEYIHKIETFVAEMVAEATKREFSVLDIKNVCLAVQQRMEMAVDKTKLKDLIEPPQEEDMPKHPLGFKK